MVLGLSILELVDAMIIDSSKDYFTGIVLLNFEGDTPSTKEINEWCSRHYGFIPSNIDIDEPNDFMGYINPGIIHCRP